MKLICFLVLPFLTAGCATSAYTTIVNGQSLGWDGTNYDRVLIVAVDKQRLAQPALHVGIPAGKHRLLVNVSKMNAGKVVVNSEVTFDAAFGANRQYYIPTFMATIRASKCLITTINT